MDLEILRGFSFTKTPGKLQMKTKKTKKEGHHQLFELFLKSSSKFTL